MNYAYVEKYALSLASQEGPDGKVDLSAAQEQ